MDKKQTTGSHTRQTRQSPALRKTNVSAAIHAPTAGSAAEALRLCNVGVDLFEKAQYDKAQDAFAKASAMVPQFPGFAANLGGALAAQKAFKEALEVLRHAYEGGEADGTLLVNLGVALGEEGEREREILQYQAALRENPDLREAHLNLGIALMDAGQPDRGIESVRKAIELSDGGWAEAHLALGYALGMLRRYEDEAAAYREALELKPNYPEALNNLGAVLRQMLRYGEAAEVFARLVPQMPHSPQPLVDQAVCLWFSGDQDGAMKIAEKAREIQPGYLPALTTIGMFWAHKGDREQARASTQRAVELYPKSAEAYFALGIVHELQNEHAAALTAYDKAVALNPRSTGVLLHRAETLRQLGQVPEAIAAYQALLNIDRDVQIGHVSLGEALLSQGQREEARESLIRAASLESTDLGALRKCAKVMVEADIPEKALEVLERIIKADPRDHESMHALGQIHAKARAYDVAVDWYERAFRLDPTYVPAGYNLATLHYTRGHYDLARKMLDLTLKLQPDHLKALNLLAKTAYKQLDPRAALEAWEKALVVRPESSTLLKNVLKVATELDDKPRVKLYYGKVMALKAEREKNKTLGNTTLLDDDDE